jgi:glycosyltransferase involved in cell wall biosynthesis
MLKLLINCGPCEEFIARCLASVRSQSYPQWEAYVTVDPCGDRTAERGFAARGNEERIFIHCNKERLYAMENLINGVRRSRAQAEDVIVVLDGDDWFAIPDALRIIADAYEQFECWLTYGSWIADDARLASPQKGMWAAYANGIDDYRNAEWLGTAVRTWKRWLWDLIDDGDFRDGQGRYLTVTEDQASMLPMLEMAGSGRARHIPEALMIYNRSTPHACGKTRYQEMLANCRYLRTRPAYPRIERQPASRREAKALQERIASLRRSIVPATRSE